MNIKVGSKNPTKLQAVRNSVDNHTLFINAVVEGVEVNVEEFGHPKSLEDTIKGAKERAYESFKDCDYSFGIESGMFPSKDAKSGYFETTMCAIYDGKDYHLGVSPSFEWPIEMIDLILSGKDGSQAFKEIGLTQHEKIGVAEGGISILTHGKINRVKLNELAITMALIHLENPKHYK